jgi:tripartite-type tricarboxylate transporter receptor subunit TctC
MMSLRWRTVALSSLSLGFLAGAQGLAENGEAPFYRGKTLTVIQGAGDPGGTADLRTKPVIQYLQKYLTGNPTFVFQYMSGGGGMAAANYMSNTAKRDGLTIAVITSSCFGNAILGSQGVRYKLDDFIFLGSPTSGGPYGLVIRPELKIDDVGRLKVSKGLRFAERSVGHTMYIIGRLMAFVVGLEGPKWVVGYSSSELRLALERKEADARANSLSGIVRETPEWFREGFSFPLVMKNTSGEGAETVPGFPQKRPVLDEFMDTEIKRAVMRFHNAVRPAGTVFIAPKGIPEAPLKALKSAFERIWRDPQFVKDYERLTKDDSRPVRGDQIEQSLRELPEDSKVMEVYKQLIGPGPLPVGK